jgi:hypothetical protein
LFNFKKQEPLPAVSVSTGASSPLIHTSTASRRRSHCTRLFPPPSASTRASLDMPPAPGAAKGKNMYSIALFPALSFTKLASARRETSRCDVRQAAKDCVPLS